MRFIADGVDIPDELLWAQDEGSVVFFCGAGISLAKAALPNFNGLTQRVLDDLRATEDDDACKLHNFAVAARAERGIGIAISDQVFQLLRRSFTDTDIGEKVANCLKPSKDVDLSAHKTLLKLAKLQTGETRIVTTNFDRLFEQCNPRLKTCTRSNLPHLEFNTVDWGIVHLHGCVKPDYSGPTGDGFVLSSAEFGDAYLAMGWARDFVRKILDHYTAVFIGYSADDPPIRYLLEGLQLSKRHGNKAYSFQADTDDRAIASWEDKGIEALTYPVTKDRGHQLLWDTLEEWTKRTADPVKWRTRTLRRSQKGPSKLAPHERGMVAHIVNSVSGANAFSQHKPAMAGEWLCVFDPLIRFGEPRAASGRSEGPHVAPYDLYHLDNDPPPHAKSDKRGRQERLPKNAWSALAPKTTDLIELGAHQISSINGRFASSTPYLAPRMMAIATWIAGVSDQPATVWWAGRQTSIHHEVLERIRPVLKDKASKKERVVAEAWRAISEYHDLQAPARDRAYELRLEAGRTGWREPLAREFAMYYSPRLKIQHIWRRPVPPQTRSNLRLNDLVHIDVAYSEGVRTIEVPDNYLQSILPKLRAALELAEDLESRYSYSVDFCSIEPDIGEGEDEGDSRHSRQYELSGHILLFVSLFRRLADNDQDAARAELATWPRNSAIFDRLRIWAMGNLDINAADHFASELLALSDEGFWPFRGQRDLLLGLARKWQHFNPHDRNALEKRILRGPTRYKRLVEHDFAERSASTRLSRIHWLIQQGCNFTFNLDDINARLRVLAPDWKPEYAENAAESHDGKSGWVRTETDFSSIESLPIQDIIPHVDGLDRRPDRNFVSYDPFRGLSKERPELALAALSADLTRQPFAQRYWETFLQASVREKDSAELSNSIARELMSIPDTHFTLITHSASDWFQKTGPELLVQSRDLFDGMWNKFIRVLQTNEQANQTSLVRENRAPDWVTESINSAPGKLAEVAVSIQLDPAPSKGSRFPKDWIFRIEQLLTLAGDSRCYALVIVGRQLGWLFYIDPVWTNENALLLIESEKSSPYQDAVWAGLFWSAQTPQRELFIRIKPHLLRMCRENSEQQAQHVEIQAGMVLSGWGSKDEATGERLVTNRELQALILDASNEFRQNIVWLLDRWSSDSKGFLAPQIVEFFRDVWPRHKKIRTAQLSARLCELALSQKSNFPEIAELISHLVTKVGDDHLFIPELRNAKETLAGQFPEAFLGLLYAVLPDNVTRWPYGTDAALRTLAQLHPAIRNDARYVELEGMLQ